MTRHYQDLDSASDWIEKSFNQSEALPRSWKWRVISMEFLRSFLRCHFAGKLKVASRNAGCFLKLFVTSHFLFLLRFKTAKNTTRKPWKWPENSEQLLLCVNNYMLPFTSTLAPSWLFHWSVLREHKAPFLSVSMLCICKSVERAKYGVQRALKLSAWKGGSALMITKLRVCYNVVIVPIGHV